MKNRFYPLIAGLLMTVCITTSGQEVISEFTHSNGLKNIGCEIVEAADGALLIGSNVHPNDSSTVFVVFKYTPEGELLDSLTFHNQSRLWTVNPLNPESQVYASCITEGASSYVKIAFIGSDFCVTDSALVLLPNLNDNCLVFGDFFFDNQNDIIVSYWNDSKLHLVRIGLDGTLKQDKEIEGLYPPSNRPDTMVYYIKTSLFNTSPQQFSLLGDIQSNYRWPVIGYTFDEDLNHIDKHIYQLIKEGILVDSGMGEHITPFDDESYLLAARIEHDNYGYAGLIKFSRDGHEPLDILLLEGNDPYRFNVAPCDTKVLDDQNIYFTYLTHPSTNNSLAFARISPDLDLEWRVTIPVNPQQVFGDSKITLLKDGRIVIGATVYRENYSKTDLHIFVIQDNYDYISETMTSKLPFSLYPNPVKDILSLRFDDGAEPESVELHDLAGRLVGTNPSGLGSIDMSAMASGVYTLCVTTKDGTRYHEKILKE